MPQMFTILPKECIFTVQLCVVLEGPLCYRQYHPSHALLFYILDLCTYSTENCALFERIEMQLKVFPAQSWHIDVIQAM